MMTPNITLNQIGIMIESLKSDVKTLSEGQKIIEDKLDRLDKKIDYFHSSLKSDIRITVFCS